MANRALSGLSCPIPRLPCFQPLIQIVAEDPELEEVSLSRMRPPISFLEHFFGLEARSLARVDCPALAKMHLRKLHLRLMVEEIDKRWPVGRSAADAMFQMKREAKEDELHETFLAKYDAEISGFCIPGASHHLSPKNQPRDLVAVRC